MKSIERFDLHTNSWSYVIPSLPKRRMSYCGCLFEEKIYIIGGFDGLYLFIVCWTTILDHRSIIFCSRYSLRIFFCISFAIRLLNVSYSIRLALQLALLDDVIESTTKAFKCIKRCNCSKSSKRNRLHLLWTIFIE